MSSEVGKKTKTLNVRVADSFEAKLTSLEARSGQKRSDIIRFGLLATWPTIEALVTANGAEQSLPAEPGNLVEILALVRSAQNQGLDLKATLVAALTAKAEADAQRAA